MINLFGTNYRNTSFVNSGLFVFFLLVSGACEAKNSLSILKYLTTYSNACIYTDTGKVSYSEIDDSGNAVTRVKYNFDTSYAKGKSLLIEWSDEIVAYSVSHDELNSRYILSAGDVTKEFHSIKSLVVASAGLSMGITNVVPRLLYGDDAYFTRSLDGYREVMISNIPYKVFEIVQNKGTRLLYFDEQNGLLKSVEDKVQNEDGSERVTSIVYSSHTLSVCK